MALSLCVYDAVVYQQWKLQSFIKLIMYIKILFILLILPKKNKNLLSDITKGWSFRFGSVFIKKKSNQIEFFKKKKPKPVQIDRFRFCFLGQKNRFKSVWLGFFGLALFFFGLALFFSVWVRFGSVFLVLGL